MIENVEKSRVSKKVFFRRNQQKLDRENNIIGLKSLVKVVNEGSYLKGYLAEIKGFYKETLFVWIKNQLPQSNGLHSVKVKDVVNAGSEFVKTV